MRLSKQLWYPLGAGAGILAASLTSRYLIHRSRKPERQRRSFDTAAWAYPSAEDYIQENPADTEQFLYATEEGQRLGERAYGNARTAASGKRHTWSYPIEEEKAYADEPLPGQSFSDQLRNDELIPTEDLIVNIETFPGHESQ